MAETGGNGGNPGEVPIGDLTKEQFFQKTFKALSILLSLHYKHPVNFILVIPINEQGREEVNFISNIKPDSLASTLRHTADLVDQQMAFESTMGKDNP